MKERKLKGTREAADEVSGKVDPTIGAGDLVTMTGSEMSAVMTEGEVLPTMTTGTV
jgi:hypothetical protein